MCKCLGVLGCARLCWCACKQWAVQRRRVLLPGGKGVWKCDRSVDKERGSNSRSRNSTSSSGSNINRSNNNDDGDPVGNWSKAAAKLTATQAIFREKPGKHNNRGQIIFSSNGNSLALKRRLYQETRLVMALFVVSANLRQTHTHSHILREREREPASLRLIKTKAQSRYTAVWKLFSIFVIWQMVTLPLWQPGHQHHHQAGWARTLTICAHRPTSVCHEVLSTISFYAGRLVVVYGSPPSDAASSGSAASSSSSSESSSESAFLAAGLCARRKKGNAYVCGSYRHINLVTSHFWRFNRDRSMNCWLEIKTGLLRFS